MLSSYVSILICLHVEWANIYCITVNWQTSRAHRIEPVMWQLSWSGETAQISITWYLKMQYSPQKCHCYLQLNISFRLVNQLINQSLSFKTVQLFFKTNKFDSGFEVWWSEEEKLCPIYNLKKGSFPFHSIALHWLRKMYLKIWPDIMKMEWAV